MSDSATAKKNLAIGRLAVGKRAPYLTTAVLSLVPYEVPPGLLPEFSAGIGVTENGILYYEAAKVAQWKTEETCGSLIHEVLHVLRDHAKRRGKRDPMVWNLAGDAEINDDILQMRINLPNAVLPTHFNKPDGLTAEEYYAAASSSTKAKSGSSGLGHGQCGSCAGNGPGFEKNLPQGIKEQGRSPEQMKVMRKQTAQAVKDFAGKQAGSVPSDLLRWAEAALGPSKIPWDQKLQMAALHAITDFVAGEADYSFDRISRRQGGIGFGAGKPVIPSTIDPVVHVWVPFDTSGSMSGDELSLGLREVKSILETGGVRTTFIACDAAMHSMAEIKELEEVRALLKGGGGTDFNPVFEAADKAQDRPCLIVYVTDGCGPAPAAPPHGIAVIWLLVGRYRQVPYCGRGNVAYGEVIHIDEPVKP